MSPGSRIGRYRIERALGRVGSAQAFSATATGIAGFEKRVVMWWMPKPGFSPAAIVEDARRAAALCHSNLAQVLDAGVEREGSFVVTEPAEGCTLTEILRQRDSVPRSLVVRAAIEVADALAYAHARRDSEGRLLEVVHGSLCADRIFFSGDGAVKLTGFGLKHALESTVPSVLRAPERASRGPVDGRADVFSLGGVLRACLGVGLPSELEAAIETAQAPWPEHRATAATLRDRLRVLLPTLDGGDPAGAAASTADTPEASCEHRAVEARGAEDSACLERRLDDDDPFADVPQTLRRAVTLGRWYVRFGSEPRGMQRLVAALDLADATGHDEHAAELCESLAKLCARCERNDESQHWQRRAIAMRSRSRLGRLDRSRATGAPRPARPRRRFLRP